MFASLWRALPLLVLATLSESVECAEIAAAWFTGFHTNSTVTPQYGLSSISWSKYTHVAYAFAETTSDVNKLSTDNSNPDLLSLFVEEAHKHDVKAMVTIGGWTGSVYFSNNVGSAENRTLFVKTVVEFAAKYNLDGFDFDWEYPTSTGIGCNTHNENDTEYFSLFLQELREHPVGANLTLSAAVATVPFTDRNGNPSQNLSAFAQALDYFELMVYDVYGPWNNIVGPNAPLNDTCASTQYQAGSAVSAMAKWNKAGVPSNQLVLGVPSYGHSYLVKNADAFLSNSTNLAPYPDLVKVHIMGDTWDTTPGVDVCGNATTVGGTINYWALIDYGFLSSNGSVNNGIYYRYDNCSQTPYVYNADTETMVSYDNVQSFTAKGEFIYEMNLKGFAMWEAGGDRNDMLLDAIRQGGQYR